MVDEQDRRLMTDLLKAIEHLTRALEDMPIMRADFQRPGKGEMVMMQGMTNSKPEVEK